MSFQSYSPFANHRPAKYRLIVSRKHHTLIDWKTKCPHEIRTHGAGIRNFPGNYAPIIATLTTRKNQRKQRWHTAADIGYGSRMAAKGWSAPSRRLSSDIDNHRNPRPLPCSPLHQGCLPLPISPSVVFLAGVTYQALQEKLKSLRRYLKD
jgi:hypothetical protein